MGFESTKGSGNTWNPTKDKDGNARIEAAPEDFIDGYYVGKKENVGENNANVYTIEKEDGTRFDVWGTTSLNGEFDKIRLGKMVRIQWHGKKRTKAAEAKNIPMAKCTSTQTFHDYEVFVDNDVPLHEKFTSGGSSVENHSKPSGAAPSPDAKKPELKAPVKDDLPF